MQNSEFKVVILQDNAKAIEELISAVSELKGFTVVGSSVDGAQGLEIIRSAKPSVVVTGLILSTLDGFAVLSKIKEENLPVKTMVLSSFTIDSVVRRALNAGALYYMVKPYEPEVFKTRLYEMVSEEEKLEVKTPSANVFKFSKNTLDEKISKIFISVGIPPHIKGYYYLREGVKMAVESPDVINNITKKLYPKIGEKFETSASKVERAIRHAIEVAWNRGRIDAINSMLGIRAYIGNEKPTNGEFIALIADKMLLDGA
jgi:two-component system response regulator (stage 0 sporulation protein A)